MKEAVAKVGDKFVIEIETTYMAFGSAISPYEPDEGIVFPSDLYKVKGFNSLVFDESGIKKLKRLEDFPFSDSKLNERYYAGMKDAWKACRDIFEMTAKERMYVFGYEKTGNVLKHYEAEEAIDAILESEKGRQDNIEVITDLIRENGKSITEDELKKFIETLEDIR